MRKITILIFALFLLQTATAQEVDDYRLYKIDEELLSSEPVVTDTLLFYRAFPTLCTSRRYSKNASAFQLSTRLPKICAVFRELFAP